MIQWSDPGSAHVSLRNVFVYGHGRVTVHRGGEGGGGADITRRPFGVLWTMFVLLANGFGEPHTRSHFGDSSSRYFPLNGIMVHTVCPLLVHRNLGEGEGGGEEAEDKKKEKRFRKEQLLCSCVWLRLGLM